MASAPTSANNPQHVRSISLPSISRPLSVKAEEGLHRLKTWAASSLLQAASSPTAEQLCVGLHALEEAYARVEELLHLPHMHRALARQQRETSNWAAEELVSSVCLLDIFSTARDAVSSIKEQARGLQSALRTRRVGDCSILEGRIHAFVHSRKKAHKDSRKCSKTLMQMERRYHASSLSVPDDDLALGIKALTDLREITVVILRSVSSFISKPTRSRWLPSSRSREAAQSASEVEEVEASLRSIHGKQDSGKDDASFEKKVEAAQKGLRRLEAGAGSLEMGLESVLRRLIQNRVSLLNTFSP